MAKINLTEALVELERLISNARKHVQKFDDAAGVQNASTSSAKGAMTKAIYLTRAIAEAQGLEAIVINDPSRKSKNVSAEAGSNGEATLDIVDELLAEANAQADG